MRRREFVRLGGAGLLLTGLDPRTMFDLSSAGVDPKSPFYEQLTSKEFPFPYDAAVFEAAERISNVRRSPADPSVWITDLNLLLKSGRAYDIKVLTAGRREDLANTPDVQTFSGVRDSLDLRLLGYDSPRLHYQVQYRAGQGAWKAHPPRNFKLPNAKLHKAGQINVFFVGDDHNFDDGSLSVTPEYVQSKITGDYFYDFVNGVRGNPKWEPAVPLDKFNFSLYLIHHLYNVLAAEDPDFLVNMGDSNGIGASYRWESWGLPFNNLTEAEYDFIARVLWLRSRKTFSAVTPNMPVFWALGNHDGDESWTGARFKARYYRQRFFPFPTDKTYPEGGHPNGNYYAFTWGADEKNRGGAQFIMLDVCGFNPQAPKKIEQWTLGREQLSWFESVLSKTDAEWSFACFHNVVGGWPAGSSELDTSAAYGRGPLFTSQDYAPYANPADVEQVKLTEMAKKYGLRAFIYGHDHVFFTRRIWEEGNTKDLYGVCVGSTKYVGEQQWWRMPLWLKHYGDGYKAIPDFFGPSGITRLTLKSDQAKFDYVVAKRTPFSNLPNKDGVEPVVCSSLVLANPPAVCQLDKTSLSFEMEECDAALPPPQMLRIRNAGGRALPFSVSADGTWIAATPASGFAFSSWADISVAVSPADFSLGTHAGTIQIAFSGTAAVPAQVSVQFLIKASSLDTPLSLEGTRIGRVTDEEDQIILTWRENPSSANIQGYRLYLVDDQGQKNLIAEPDTLTFDYVFQGARKERFYRFALTAANIRGRESAPVWIVVPKIP